MYLTGFRCQLQCWSYRDWQRVPSTSSTAKFSIAKVIRRQFLPVYHLRRPFSSKSVCNLHADETSTAAHVRPEDSLPLSNLRILDLSRVLAGPFCTQILADYGATVLKVEQPGTGDETRQWRTAGETGQMWNDEYIASRLPSSSSDSVDAPMMSLYFASVNRNKRSMTLDLKSSRAIELIKKMLTPHKGHPGTHYDIIVDNFLPGKMDAMGLSYKTLKAINPGLIYASVSGYGASGPSSKRAGYDAIALAEAGLLHITGSRESGPTKPGVAIADLCTGLYMHGAILAAVNARRDNGGVGCKIDASLFESSLSLLINVGLASLNLDLQGPSGKRRRGSRLGLGHPNLVPYGGYRTKDGRQLFVAANNNRQWKAFCERTGIHKDFAEKYNTNDSRVENRSVIDTVLGEKFAKKTVQEWEDVFEGSSLPYGAINDVVEALEHKQADARDMVVSVKGIRAARDGLVKMIGPAVKFSGDRADQKQRHVVRRNPPLLGEHTNEVLQEMGYGEAEVNQLTKNLVV